MNVRLYLWEKIVNMSSLFKNTEIAFSIKTNAELERAFYLFKLIQRESLVKVGTALTKFALKTKMPVEGLIRSTVFDHFCGGVTEEDCKSVIDKMMTKNVHSILDYSAEGKEDDEQFDYAMSKTLGTIKFATEDKGIPFAVFKPTGFGRFALYQKISEKRELTEEESREWGRVVARYEKVSSEAAKNGVPLLIDAEESWMQDAADDLIEAMMEKYNKEKVVVFGTLQCYRIDRLDYLKALHERAKEKGYKIGMKLVRGAYMEKERERAEKYKYEDPICATKADTDDMYNGVMTYMFEHLDEMAIFCGTHNEESSELLVNMIKEKNYDKSDERLWFGQLYGMSDHISFNLSALDFNVAKYLPFGPVRDVMPYLIRRAEENTSVAGQTSRELDLLEAERKRRKI